MLNSHSIGDAARIIKYDDADVMVAGGSEYGTTPTAMAGFVAAKAMSTRNDEPEKASRPFDRDRDGIGDLPFRPVRLFSLVVEQNEPAVVLQRSLLVALLDLAEAVLPVLTPAGLADAEPVLSPVTTPWRTP